MNPTRKVARFIRISTRCTNSGAFRSKIYMMNNTKKVNEKQLGRNLVGQCDNCNHCNGQFVIIVIHRT